MIEKNAKVVVAGDFSRIGMKDSKFLEEHFHLTAVLSPEKATNKLGGHLDNVWTNLTITGSEIIDNLDEISDHSLINVKLRIEETVKRGLPYKGECNYHAADIKRHLFEKNTKDHFKKPDSLKEPIRKLLKTKSSKEKRRNICGSPCRNGGATKTAQILKQALTLESEAGEPKS